jgi:hypothetical protein
MRSNEAWQTAGAYDAAFQKAHSLQRRMNLFWARDCWIEIANGLAILEDVVRPNGHVTPLSGGRSHRSQTRDQVSLR